MGSSDEIPKDAEKTAAPDKQAECPQWYHDLVDYIVYGKPLPENIAKYVTGGAVT